MENLNWPFQSESNLCKYDSFHIDSFENTFTRHKGEL